MKLTVENEGEIVSVEWKSTEWSPDAFTDLLERFIYTTGFDHREMENKIVRWGKSLEAMHKRNSRKG